MKPISRSISFLVRLLIPLLILLALLIIFNVFPIDDADIGWHLAIGRSILQTGVIPRTNLLSHTFAEYPWYATSWLFDVLVYGVTRLGGIPALQILQVLLLLLTGIITALGIQASGARRLGALPWLAAGLVLVIPRLAPRPMLVSWLIFALCVFGLQQIKKGSRKWLWILPLAVGLGSNFHSGGVFAVILAALTSVGTWLDSRLKRGETITAGVILRLFGVTIAMAAALVANPGGFYNLRYLLEHQNVNQVIQVMEFLPMSWPLDAPAFCYLFASAGLWIFSRKRSLSSALTIAFFGVLALRYCRFGVEFFLVTAAGTASLLEERMEKRLVARPWFSPAFFAGVLSLFLWLAPFGVRELLPQVGTGFNPLDQPVGAAEYLERTQARGKLYHVFDVGGYLAWRLYPRMQIFQDSRIQAYPPAFFSESSPALRDADALTRIADQYGVDYAVMQAPRGIIPQGPVLPLGPWALVFFDDHSQVFARRGRMLTVDAIARDEINYTYLK